ncbi:MAG: TonB-dependent receptor, partial [Saprospiraceae bacterium]|nr:TonB-dependent receptor [Saprospiraceae bacterium]
NLVAGLDWRYYKGIHYRRVENLLGADGYSSKSDINNVDNFITTEEPAEFGSFGADGYKNGNNVLNYYNDGLVNWLGLFAQVEHVTDNATIFAAVSGSNQGFKRVDYFNYLDSDPQQETDWENILGGTIKAGANFNLDDNNNVFVNAGYYSKQPIFDNVYINFVNDLNENVKNQTVAAFEAGYGYRSRDFNVKANVYYTNWGNRQFDIFTENDQNEDILYNFEDVDQTHIGLELEAMYQPSRKLQFTGMLSIGDWKYSSNPTARGTNIDTQQPVADATLFIDGLEVGDAAQTTFNIGVTYEITNGLRIYADYYNASRLFAQYDVNDDRFFVEGAAAVLELPSYSLVDAGISYSFDLGDDLRAALRFNMNNVFDELYISELVTNDPDDLYGNQGIF